MGRQSLPGRWNRYGTNLKIVINFVYLMITANVKLTGI